MLPPDVPAIVSPADPHLDPTGQAETQLVCDLADLLAEYAELAGPLDVRIHRGLEAVRRRFGLKGRATARTAADIDPSKTRAANQANLDRAMAKPEALLRRPPQTAKRLKKLRRAKERAA